MSRRTRDLFENIHSEGGLLPPDLLKRIAEGDKGLPGLSPESYHLAKGERLNEMINRSWNRLLGAWASFREAAEKLAANSPDAGVTRDRWLGILFQELGYGQLEATPKAREIEGKAYPISHFRHASPIHLIGFRTKLDERTKGVRGAATQSPHSLVQEFLNRSDEHLWGFLSNGFQLRILRDNVSLIRQAYVEVDLVGMMEGEAYADFALLWLLAHQSRVEPRARPSAADDDGVDTTESPAPRPEECWLEQWSHVADQQGTRIREDLRQGVEKATKALGQGFLAWPTNDALRADLRTGALDKQDYYRELLRVVYRLLFLFVAEDRELLLLPEADTKPEARQRYDTWYSTRRLRRLAERRRGSPHPDLYQGLRVVMEKLGSDAGCTELALPALGSFLWSREAIPNLAEADVANRGLLEAVRALAFTEQDRRLRAVDYRNLGSEELGSIYESLLELHPEVDTQGHHFELHTAVGHERKTTGSYYTPTSLIQCLLDSALEPVLDAACQREDPERAILELKVCDPACGSGHFLIAAAHRMARRLATVRTGEDEPAPEPQRTALRDVIGRSLYGVDMNPMAVELCKVSLWLEALDPGTPLSFLEHHIQCGNSLLGARPADLAGGIPEAALNPITGDDQKVCSTLKKMNRAQRGGQLSLLGSSSPGASELQESIANALLALSSLPDHEIGSIHRKESEYARLKRSPDYVTARQVADAWCAAFLWEKREGAIDAITDDVFRRLANSVTSVSPRIRAEVQRLSVEYRFFHWHLAFPDVFGRKNKSGDASEDAGPGWDGGFDVVIGNPPWERIKLQEKEFFATRDTDIASAPPGKRKKLIEDLSRTNPELHREFVQASRRAEGESHFARTSGVFPLCGRGDVNTYSLFAELMRTIVGGAGSVGCIVPSGIATDETNKLFFQAVLDGGQLSRLLDFENRRRLFPNVDGRMRFSLMTLRRSKVSRSDAADFGFFLHDTQGCQDPDRLFELTSADIQLLNPNSRTCPIFRSRTDAQLNKSIYRRVPVLIREGPPRENPWGVSISTMFHMTSDAGLFHDRASLEEDGWRLEGNVFKKDGEERLPVFEGKMVAMYDHRAASIVVNPKNPFRQQQAELSSVSAHLDPAYRNLPFLWGSPSDARNRVPEAWGHDWFLTFKRVTAATNERTVVGCVVPWSPVSYTLYLVTCEQEQRGFLLGLIANLFSLLGDYVVRQKTLQPSLPIGVVLESAMLGPGSFASPCPWDRGVSTIDWVRPRVVELCYSSDDLAPFARDNGFDGSPFPWDEKRRFQLRCELDAAVFHLYGLGRAEVEHVLDSFTTLAGRELRKYGEPRTKRRVLALYDELGDRSKDVAAS